MVLYSVYWCPDTELKRGKGRIKKSDDYHIRFSVLCRTSSDALRCLAWHFRHHYVNSIDLTLDDGVIQLKRQIVDSRSFSAKYLMMDGIKEPIILSDVLNDNILRVNHIFRHC